MKCKTDKQMSDEIMAGGQLERMKASLESMHGGNIDAVNAATELFEQAQSLQDQAIRKGYHQFDVFEQMMIANEKVTLEAAGSGGGSAAGVLKL